MSEVIKSVTILRNRGKFPDAIDEEPNSAVSVSLLNPTRVASVLAHQNTSMSTKVSSVLEAASKADYAFKNISIMPVIIQ